MMEKFITKPWVKAVLEAFKTQEVDTLKARIDGLSGVQSDWDELDSTSDAYIKHKPTIPAAVTESTVSGWGFTKNTGTYSKPSSGIPASDLAQGVIPDVSGFASKVSNATNGHLAGLDANGNLTDSGFKIITITESDYEALSTKDNNTLYLITES